jgi:cbb3-type cytochrome oxidase maturation protein
MEIVTLLIGLALILVIVMIWAFFWAVRSGQFDDMEGPAHRIIMEEDQRPAKESGDEESEK